MKFYIIDIMTRKVKKVADSVQQLVDNINDETIDTENNWLASERELDKLIVDRSRII